MSVRKSIFSVLVILALASMLSACDALAQRVGSDGAPAPEDSGVNEEAESPIATLEVEQLPEGEGIGGGALEPIDIATAIAQTLEAQPSQTPVEVTVVIEEEVTSTPEPSTPTPTVSATISASATVPGAQFTALANTLTAIVVSSTPTPTPTLTPTPGDEGGGADSPTSTTGDGSTSSSSTSTSTSESPSATPDGECLALRFIADVTIPDGTSVQPRQIFFKSWYIQNIGSCRWESDFRLVFHSGEPMGAKESFELGTVVYPNQYVTVSAQMVAPDLGGYYRSNWGLQDTLGNFFGYTIDGKNYDQPFYVEIFVLGASSPNFGGSGQPSVVVTAPPFTPRP